MRQGNAPAFGGGRCGETQSILGTACRTKTTCRTELRREAQYEVCIFDVRLQCALRTQVRTEATGIAAAVESEVPMHSGRKCAVTKRPCGRIERRKRWICRIFFLRFCGISSPTFILPRRSISIGARRIALQHPLSRMHLSAIAPRTACRICLPKLLLRSIAKAAKKIAATVLACGRLRILQAKQRSPCRFQGSIGSGRLAAKMRIDGGYARSARANIELHFLF